MKTLSLLFSLILLVSMASCNRRASPASPMLGEYELVGLDASGQRAFTGTILLTSVEQNHLDGQCKIIREKNAHQAILDQTPRCQAVIQGRKITIDLAPFLDDGGLLLEGEIGQGKISGLWMFKTIAGTQRQGKFDASKK